MIQDICTVVPRWIRYKELIAILEASLQDIVDRWADGKVLTNSNKLHVYLGMLLSKNL